MPIKNFRNFGMMIVYPSSSQRVAKQLENRLTYILSYLCTNIVVSERFNIRPIMRYIIEIHKEIIGLFWMIRELVNNPFWYLMLEMYCRYVTIGGDDARLIRPLIKEWIIRFRQLTGEFPVQHSKWVELNQWYDKAVENSPENLLRHTPDKKRSPKVLFRLAMMVDNTFVSTELIGILRYCLSRRYNRRVIHRINTALELKSPMQKRLNALNEHTDDEHHSYHCCCPDCDYD